MLARDMPGGQRRSTAACGALVALLCCAADASAHRVAPFDTPVEVRLLGPDAVRVRVAAGVNLPCDSLDNRPLVNGRFKAGDIVRATAFGDGCVCFQQTYAPLVDSDWSTPARICSACSFNPQTRVWLCPPQRDPTIRISVSSSR